MLFNILCENTDVHARNHAVFSDSKHISFTPAYNIFPQARAGNVQGQAILIHGNNNASQLKTCLATAQHFLLSHDEVNKLQSSRLKELGDIERCRIEFKPFSVKYNGLFNSNIDQNSF